MSTLDNDIVIQSNLNFNGLKDSFTLPSVDLSNYSVPDFTTNPVAEPTQITSDLLTDTTVDGSGIFDKLMTSVSNHLQNELDESRIEQDKFGDIYSNVMVQAMTIASQYSVQQVTANYQNQLLKKQLEQQEIQNETTKINLEITKLNAATAQFNANNSSAQFALTKQQLANSNADYCLKKQQLEIGELNKLSITKDNILKDVEAEIKELDKISLTNQHVTQTKEHLQLDKNLETSEQQRLNLISDLLTKTKQQTLLDTDEQLKELQKISVGKQDLILDVQKISIDKDNLIKDTEALIKTQQVDSERAKTKDTLTDGSLLGGLFGVEKTLKGSQNQLYITQKDTFETERKLKVAKVMSDSWSIRKAQDVGTAAPNNFTNEEIDDVLNKLRVNVGIS